MKGIKALDNFYAKPTMEGAILLAIEDHKAGPAPNADFLRYLERAREQIEAADKWIETMRELVEMDEKAREAGARGYAIGSPTARLWNKARSLLVKVPA